VPSYCHSLFRVSRSSCSGFRRHVHGKTFTTVQLVCKGIRVHVEENCGKSLNSKGNTGGGGGGGGG
jgi:hypothetical protein